MADSALGAGVTTTPSLSDSRSSSDWSRVPLATGSSTSSSSELSARHIHIPTSRHCQQEKYRYAFLIVLASRVSGCHLGTETLKSHPLGSGRHLGIQTLENHPSGHPKHFIKSHFLENNCLFAQLNTISITLYTDIMPYFNKLIHIYGCHLNLLRSLLKYRMPNNFTIANF